MISPRPQNHQGPTVINAGAGVCEKCMLSVVSQWTESTQHHQGLLVKHQNCAKKQSTVSLWAFGACLGGEDLLKAHGAERLS